LLRVGGNLWRYEYSNSRSWLLIAFRVLLGFL
jgi:hypothetical protein